ncbi:DsbA family oxidoreductase [Actinocrinis puniceicyclus]|uniref:DsbA family oxidoreductase n=1 Tax=Actinocrinis puniceicyclus TaxID=977794 RepID=A0A8J7WQQ6_9ACTN|nr:DsbA family oxidoreductase [Actinocrinis puniceicyclus]MBS2964677.1 DsbA family oxidoreductase [Actinocrinis puniceicyclus]
MKVEVYSDIACPWCYIGKHRFERALSAFAGAAEVEVVYRPYQLDPGAPATASPHREYLDRKFGPGSAQMDARVAQIGRGEGIAFDFDHALHVNTLDGHRLLRLALTEYGPAVQSALKEKLLAARFAEGGDVGDRNQLIEAAAAAGVDRDRARAYLDSGEGREDVLDEIAEARARGVSSVPTFVFDGRWAVSGAQETEVFLRVLEQVSAAGE